MSSCYAYQPQDGSVTLAAALPCATGKTCCFAQDICLSNGICGISHAERSGSYSGYYVGFCADPTFQSPDCHNCMPIDGPDVVYNYSTSRWACCGLDANGRVSCDKPKNVTFSAPLPLSLSTIGVAKVGSGFSTTTASDTSTTAVPNTSTSNVGQETHTYISPGNSTLDPGSQAAIILAAIIAATLTLLIAAWFYRRHKRQLNRSSDHLHHTCGDSQTQFTSETADITYHIAPRPPLRAAHNVQDGVRRHYETYGPMQHVQELDSN